jgi:hypothetical protein
MMLLLESKAMEAISLLMSRASHSVTDLREGART